MKRSIGLTITIAGVLVLSGIRMSPGTEERPVHESHLKKSVKVLIHFGKEVGTLFRRPPPVSTDVTVIPKRKTQTAYKKSPKASKKGTKTPKGEAKTVYKEPLPGASNLAQGASLVDSNQPDPVPDEDEVVFIPEGGFLMGSSAEDIDTVMVLCEESRKAAPNIQCDRSNYKDETPQHSVYLDAFYIDKYPVTNRQFQKFVEATGYVTDAEKDRIGLVVSWAGDYEGEVATQEDGSVSWRHPGGKGSGIAKIMDHPVVQVSWNDALAYCQWAGKRLPTEAEWEKAARGTDGRLFPWGNEAPDAKGKYRANYGKDRGKADKFEYTSPVGSFPLGASPYGVMDMSGNVWEWVADWYDENYYQISPAKNPQGPESGMGRVLRGGSWGNRPESIRTATRFRSEPSSGISYIGFRCAR